MCMFNSYVYVCMCVCVCVCVRVCFADDCGRNDHQLFL